MRHKARTFQRLLVLLALGAAVAPAAGWQIDSGPARVLMIELYTSEGCNSCPPAEALINDFVDNPGLWRRFVPLAFHVDYWDYLGWKDRYALPENAIRQRRYASLGYVRGVYTPGLMVNGRGWRPGWGRREPRGDDQPAGRLRLQGDAHTITASYAGPGAAQGRLQLNIALLGMGLASDIQRGENAGRHARHDFVVLARGVLPGEGGQWQGRLPALTGEPPARMALAAWVSRPGDPTPLQAAGGFITLR